MESGQIYREVLVGMFEDYEPIQRPLWVEAGLLEEGLAEYDGDDMLQLTDMGVAASEAVEARRAKAVQIRAVTVVGDAVVAA